MKRLILLTFIAVVIVILSACSNPDPMSPAEADAIKACVDAGHMPKFDAQANGRRLFECNKKDQK